MTRIRPLAGGRHAVYRIASDLLLVFKPRGHREAEHVHPHPQRLRVLRGRLQVRGPRVRELTPTSRPYRLPAGRPHSTVALADTWLLAERIHTKATPPTTRR